MKSARQLIILSDKLEYPPRLGHQLHLLSIARAASSYAETTAVCWESPRGDTAGNGTNRSTWDFDQDGLGLELLGSRQAHKRFPWRTLDYARKSSEILGEIANPQSVVWIRGYSTALSVLPLILRGIDRSRRPRLLYDAASIQRLEGSDGMGAHSDVLRGLIEEKLWKYFDHIRTLGEPMKEYLVGKGVPLERILVIPVGTDRRNEIWNPAQPPRRVLYVGSDRPWQGLNRLLEAMAELENTNPDIQLSVGGVNGGKYASYAKRSNIQFHGSVTHERALQMYTEHDLFALPRHDVPLTRIVTPMKIPEAMSFGIPILTTDLAAVRSVTGDEGAVFIPDNSTHAIAEGIGHALSNVDLLLSVSASSKRRVEYLYWDRIGETLNALLFENA
jgi:glycosyltransferase involved in cell wall biosynthesis